MKTSLFRRGAVLLGLTLAALALPVTAAAGERCTVSKLEMPVTMVGARPVVKIGINGTQIPVLVDSGAFFSFLSPAAADQLKLRLRYLPFNMRIEGLAGEVEARLTVVEHMQLEGGEIPNIDFIVGGNEIGAGAMGILGRNILTLADVEFDLANGVIRLFFPKGDCSETSFAYWAGDKPYVVLPLLRDDRRSLRPEIRAVAQVNDRKIKVMFDSGAYSSMLSLSAARSAGIKPEQMTPIGETRGAGKGTLKTWSTTLDRFALGDEQISNIRMFVSDMDLNDEDMLLGADFFLAHRIYVSKAQRRMYFTHNGGPVFALSAQAIAQAKAAEPVAPASAASPMPAASAASNTAAAEADPALDAAGYARRGAGHAARHDYPAALADLNRACALAPDQPDYLVQRGVVHLALRQGREARQDFDAALQLDPHHAEALLHRAAMQPTSTGGEAALADLKTLDATLPPQAAERRQMARIYERFDRTPEAIVQLTHWAATRETDIDLPTVLSLRCTLRMKLGAELDEALKDCDRAVRADGKNPAFREGRGLLRLKRGELDRALSDFDKALELKADLPWSLYGRGIVRGQRGQTDAARADLEAARKLLPKLDAEVSKFGLPPP